MHTGQTQQRHAYAAGPSYGSALYSPYPPAWDWRDYFVRRAS
jgi:hypothetical protein